ncbi:MAG: DUF2264 domain-containing protein [Opitutus sp.]|nr:DUF2264 domain-containing protein [Opitutus sp.]
MKTRRAFLKLTTTSALVAAAATQTRAAALPPSTATLAAGISGTDDRAAWARLAQKLAHPVLTALAERRLKATMPVEASPKSQDRPSVTHLEALGRLLCGLAPWFELGTDVTPEGLERARLAALARTAIDSATDPKSPDFLNFSKGSQPLVDSAFLAQAMLRAPTELWKKLEPPVQQNVIAALKSSRPIQPGENNWKLFATTVEVFLHAAGAGRDEARLLEGINKHAAWYVGDGMYGDGPEFHWDYYNAFVIQPMLYEALEVVGDETPELKIFRGKVRERLTRFAAIQERLIAPDGTYPVIGRSVAYRCGAFQGLALAALRHLLPAEVKPAQARVALTTVIRRTLEAAGTFDDRGWLRIGVAGSQPGLGESYISTGSLYLCSAALLPLGLPASDPYWSDPSAATTWQKIWSGADLPTDHAIRSPR